MDENPTPRPADERPVFALLTSHWRGHLFGYPLVEGGGLPPGPSHFPVSAAKSQRLLRPGRSTEFFAVTRSSLSRNPAGTAAGCPISPATRVVAL